MELNEKIAARRRELALEAEKIAQAEIARQNLASIQAAKAKKAEKDAIDAEVAKQLAAMGIAPTPSNVLPKPSKPTKSIDIASGTKNDGANTGSTATKPPSNSLDTEVEKAIVKAASARMTGGENTKFSILILLGIGGFFIAWWVALIFIAWAFSYLSNTTARHKEQILAEGAAKLEKDKREGEAFDEVAVPVLLLETGEHKNEVIGNVTGLGISDSKDRDHF